MADLPTYGKVVMKSETEHFFFSALATTVNKFVINKLAKLTML